MQIRFPCDTHLVNVSVNETKIKLYINIIIRIIFMYNIKTYNYMLKIIVYYKYILFIIIFFLTL